MHCTAFRLDALSMLVRDSRYREAI